MCAHIRSAPCIVAIARLPTTARALAARRGSRLSIGEALRDLMFVRLTAIRLLAISAVSLSTAFAGPVVTPLSDGSPASAATLANMVAGATPGLSVVPDSSLYTGAFTASGTFTAGGTGPTGLGINTGVVLSTGDARFIGSSAAFPGDSPNKSTTFTAGIGNVLTPNLASGSSLFNSLAPFGTANASILSFEFVPQGTTLTLQLVFGSEDYNDLVNSGFPTDV